MRQKVTIKILKLCLLACVSLANAESANNAKPSFDCVNAKSNTEKTICSDEGGELQNLDRYMGEVYTQLIYELKKSNFSDKDKRLKDILQSQRDFIRDREKLFEIDDIKHLYQKRTIALLKDLGAVLDSNNKELCEYARAYKDDLSKWRKIEYSVNDPLYTLGFCLGSDYNYKYCTYGKLTQKQKFINNRGLYAEPQIYVKKLDINNDGKKETIMFLSGDSSNTLYVLSGNQLNENASDRIYGDDLHFSGEDTFGKLWNTTEIGERISFVINTYALPSNKISKRFDFKMFEEIEIFDFNSEEDIKRNEQENITPQFVALFYGIMEFKEKNYIHLTSNRFFWNETQKYPNVRIYLLDGNKRELKCTYFKRMNYNHTNNDADNKQ